MTNINVASVLDEINSGKVTLVCGKHNYTAARKRANGTFAIPPETSGCKDCWKVYYVTQHALTAPNKRQEALEELESVINHAVEFQQKGKFGDDFELFDVRDSRFKVEYEKDGE